MYICKPNGSVCLVSVVLYILSYIDIEGSVGRGTVVLWPMGQIYELMVSIISCVPERYGISRIEMRCHGYCRMFVCHCE